MQHAREPLVLRCGQQPGRGQPEQRRIKLQKIVAVRADLAHADRAGEGGLGERGMAAGKPGGFSARGGVNTKLKLLGIEGAAAAVQADLFAS